MESLQKNEEKMKKSCHSSSSITDKSANDAAVTSNSHQTSQISPLKQGGELNENMEGFRSSHENEEEHKLLGKNYNSLDDDDVDTDDTSVRNHNVWAKRQKIPSNIPAFTASPENECTKLKFIFILLFIGLSTTLAYFGMRRDTAEHRHSNEDTEAKTTGNSPIFDTLGENGSSNSVLNLHNIKFDPNAALHQHDPFHVMDQSWYGSVFTNPPHPSSPSALPYNNGINDSMSKIPRDNIGYIQYPNIHNNTLVFATEGDIYLTTLPIMNNNSPNSVQLPVMSAMRLTSTVGNANTPHINPKYPFLIAFTATYTGNREAYIMDLRPEHRSQPSMRLTYMDSAYGVLAIVGWEDDGRTLVVKAYSMEVAMEDERLYRIGVLVNNDKEDPTSKKSFSSERYQQHQDKNFLPNNLAVSDIKPIPLSQAIDSTVDERSGCRYFTRFRQSSHTIRYVGGTAESLWALCPDQELAVPLTSDYQGASKAPRIYTIMINGAMTKILLFMSDRSGHVKGQTWEAASMNLWGILLPTEDDLYTAKKEAKNYLETPFQITSSSCAFGGLPLVEYAVDELNGNIVLRIGADLHLLSKKYIKQIIRENIEMKTNRVLQNNVKKPKAFDPISLPIAVFSDFNNLHERTIPLKNSADVSTTDIYDTAYGTLSALMVARGQLFVNPVRDTCSSTPYDGGAMNMPSRRYRITPGSMTGGLIRVLGAWNIPNLPNQNEENVSRMSIVLATDPLSITAEMAFYLIETSSESIVEFADISDLPIPFFGGHVNGGSVKDGGLGSIYVDSVTVSSVGNRIAWTDTDGRIVVLTLPNSVNIKVDNKDYAILPSVNENDEPMKGIEAGLTWSPGGRYLAIEHNARNQFNIISIVDLGDPNSEKIHVGRIVQATSDRFNSMSPFWGRSSLDFKIDKLSNITPNEKLGATTLYFLSDRDIILSSKTSSPWGTRAPGPFFPKKTNLYSLPLVTKEDQMTVEPMKEMYGGNFVGNGAAELMPAHVSAWTRSTQSDEVGKRTRRLLNNDDSNKFNTIGYKELGTNNLRRSEVVPNNDTNVTCNTTVFTDVPISFGSSQHPLAFARRAYVMSKIPASDYLYVFQLNDGPSLLVAERSEGVNLILFHLGSFPSDSVERIDLKPEGTILQSIGLSTDRNYLYATYSGNTKVIQNTLKGILEFVGDLSDFSKNIVDTDDWFLSVWPKLEYQQMYDDAWRMLRDYYYDARMGNVDWMSIHSKFLPLVSRCGRREELDDVLAQMASELSALHVFVYGGEYNDPLHGHSDLKLFNEVASLGAVLERSVEWSGYIVHEIPETDPDFNSIDGNPIYSPLSARTLNIVGQKGLEEGDIIVSVNGEGVMNVPDIHMMLRGMAGRSVRLGVVRIKSKSSFSLDQVLKSDKGADLNITRVAEPVIVVPISRSAAQNLRYSAWEWKTRTRAKMLAQNAGFTLGYIHLRSMSGSEAEDSFVRDFYPDYDKQALIIDVRHNHGGNIDSWLLDVLQRKAWMYWQGRATNITNGGLGWDEQFAFRGHLVVLIDEKTSSDGEGKF